VLLTQVEPTKSVRWSKLMDRLYGPHHDDARQLKPSAKVRPRPHQPLRQPASIFPAVCWKIELLLFFSFFFLAAASDASAAASATSAAAAASSSSAVLVH